jgi:hypothetical protein
VWGNSWGKIDFGGFHGTRNLNGLGGLPVPLSVAVEGCCFGVGWLPLWVVVEGS